MRSLRAALAGRVALCGRDERMTAGTGILYGVIGSSTPCTTTYPMISSWQVQLTGRRANEPSKCRNGLSFREEPRPGRISLPSVFWRGERAKIPQDLAISAVDTFRPRSWA